MTDNTAQMSVGSRIRHNDGTPGTVTAIHDGKPGERLIEWKYGTQWRVSSERVLSLAKDEKFRWRR